MRTESRFNLNFIILSAGYILLGFIMLLAGEAAQHWICLILGIVVMALGLLRIAYFFVRNAGDRFSRTDLPIGVVLLAAGVYLIAKPDALWSWLPVLLGFAILFDSVVKLQQSLEMKHNSLHLWWIFSIAAVATIVLAVLLIIGIFSGATLQYFFGAALIADGIVNLVVQGFLFYSRGHAGHQSNGKKQPAQTEVYAAELVPVEDD